VQLIELTAARNNLHRRRIGIDLLPARLRNPGIDPDPPVLVQLVQSLVVCRNVHRRSVVVQFVPAVATENHELDELGGGVDIEQTQGEVSRRAVPISTRCNRRHWYDALVTNPIIRVDGMDDKPGRSAGCSDGRIVAMAASAKFHRENPSLAGIRPKPG
jgi:hypothetical protein